MFMAWLIGLAMLYLIYNSKHKKMLRVTRAGLWRLTKFLSVVTAVRLFWIYCVASPEALQQIGENINYLPWQTMFGVFWEDAVHVLPLALMSKMYSDKKLFKYWYAILTTLVAASFGSAHSYQGLQACVTLAFYIPLALKMGRKYGFGTVILGHVLFDLVTTFTFKLALGV